MNSHRITKRRMYEYLRGELTERDRRMFEAHVNICRRCSSELQAIREATELLDTNLRRPNQHRNEFYWQQFADKVDRRIELDSEESSETSMIRQILESLVEHRKPFGIGFASALALVMIAFGVWSIWMRNPLSRQSTFEQSEGQAATATVQKASLDSRAQDYLEQSKVLLIGLMNTDTKTLGASGSFMQREQEISRKLVSESADLTSKLNDPSQRRLKELISDLQLILIQIANLEARHDLPGVEIIKGGIEHNDILFKINLEEIQRTTKSVAGKGETVKRTT